MEVEWSTMAAIARTQAVDVWILFPAGIGVNRQLPVDGNVPAWARAAFTRLFGTPDWYDRFYAKHAMDDMFGGQTEFKRSVHLKTSSRFIANVWNRFFPMWRPILSCCAIQITHRCSRYSSQQLTPNTVRRL